MGNSNDVHSIRNICEVVCYMHNKKNGKRDNCFFIQHIMTLYLDICDIEKVWSKCDVLVTDVLVTDSIRLTINR